MPEDFEELESEIKQQFNDLPEDEKVRFFVSMSMLLLDDDQLRNMIRIIQQRL